MSEIVFILGAGASKDCGAPLMNDFLDTASRLLGTNQVPGKNDDFKRVFRAIASMQAVHSKSQLDLNNIESIFTALEIANALGKLPGFNKAEIPQVIASLKELIVVTLEQTIDFPTRKNRILAPSSYSNFSELLLYLSKDANPAIVPAIVSFNYDIALDVAMYRAGLGPIYGFGPSVQAHYQVPLLKLHGSLNWAVRKSSGAVEPLTIQQYFSKYSYNGFEEQGTCKMPVGSQLQEYYSKHTDVEVNPEPVIVPPAWNKADYHQTLASIWSDTAKHLEEAEYIFIIGYSLPETDAFFRLLYGLGTVGETLLKKVVVYNPDQSGVTESRFKDMLGPGALARFEYKPMVFSEAIGDIRNFFPGRT
ncbi:hypothetical protein ACFOSD_09430 [Salinispirillum marinum]|uniref:SIR2-like domain-containing protein n=2 Tax=Saccharospirillaceae TaxID=255527 RepID=A0ABV8BFH5_9GAMM